MSRSSYTSRIKKFMWIYILPFLLSAWGVGNVIYWEIYKGYSACAFCRWHRGLYIAMFILCLLLLKWRKNLIRFLITGVLAVEVLVASLQVCGYDCGELICRRISLADKLNLAMAGFVLAVLLVIELKCYFAWGKFGKASKASKRH
jgi:hypothetical protein